MNHLISTFCVGKYAPIADYVKGVTIQDLTKLNHSEIIQSLPHQIRLHMELFLKDSRVQRAIFWTPGMIYNSDDIDDDDDIQSYEQPFENVSKIEDTGILNLCNQIHPPVNIKKFNELLSKNGNTSYTYIDLSWNKLYDNDLTSIVDVIKKSNIDVKAISLACNNISGYSKTSRQKTDENLHYLLEKCEYVDITMTPVATIDRLDFFKSLEKDSPSFLLKLIWIPERWLEAKVWTNMIIKELQDEVRDIHRQYYRWIRTLPLDNENNA